MASPARLLLGELAPRLAGGQAEIGDLKSTEANVFKVTFDEANRLKLLKIKIMHLDVKILIY